MLLQYAHIAVAITRLVGVQSLSCDLVYSELAGAEVTKRRAAHLEFADVVHSHLTLLISNCISYGCGLGLHSNPDLLTYAASTF
jgi:hypothetical protein